MLKNGSPVYVMESSLDCEEKICESFKEQHDSTHSSQLINGEENEEKILVERNGKFLLLRKAEVESEDIFCAGELNAKRNPTNEEFSSDERSQIVSTECTQNGVTQNNNNVSPDDISSNKSAKLVSTSQSTIASSIGEIGRDKRRRGNVPSYTQPQNVQSNRAKSATLLRSSSIQDWGHSQSGDRQTDEERRKMNEEAFRKWLSKKAKFRQEQLKLQKLESELKLQENAKRLSQLKEADHAYQTWLSRKMREAHLHDTAGSVQRPATALPTSRTWPGQTSGEPSHYRSTEKWSKRQTWNSPAKEEQRGKRIDEATSGKKAFQL